jgi:hypothetical protein
MIKLQDVGIVTFAFSVLTATVGKASPYSGTVEINTMGSQRSIAIDFHEYRDPVRVCGNELIPGCCFKPMSFVTGHDVDRTDVSAGTFAFLVNGLGLTLLGPPGPGERYSIYMARPMRNSGMGIWQAWQAGDVIRIMASGDIIHKFSGNVTVPPPIEGLVPSLTHPPPAPHYTRPGPQISTPFALVGGPLTVRWKAFQGTSMEVSLTGDGGAVICVAADADGSVTFPSEEMARFRVGEEGYIGFLRTVETRPDSGPDNAEIQFLATQNDGFNIIFVGPHN